MLQTLDIKNVKSIIYASWLIYLKYQMVNNRMLNINDINKAYMDEKKWANMDKNLFLTIANFL